MSYRVVRTAGADHNSELVKLWWLGPTGGTVWLCVDCGPPPPPHPLKIRDLARLSIRVPCVSLMLFFGLKKILVNLTFFTGLLRTWTLDPARLRIQKTVESETLLSCCSPPTMLPISRTDREINKLQLTSLIAGYKRVCVCVWVCSVLCVCVWVRVKHNQYRLSSHAGGAQQSSETVSNNSTI